MKSLYEDTDAMGDILIILIYQGKIYKIKGFRHSNHRLLQAYPRYRVGALIKKKGWGLDPLTK